MLVQQLIHLLASFLRKKWNLFCAFGGLCAMRIATSSQNLVWVISSIAGSIHITYHVAEVNCCSSIWCNFIALQFIFSYITLFFAFFTFNDFLFCRNHCHKTLLVFFSSNLSALPKTFSFGYIPSIISWAISESKQKHRNNFWLSTAVTYCC